MIHSVFSPCRSRHTRRLELHLRLARLCDMAVPMPVPQQGSLRELRRAIGRDIAEVSTQRQAGAIVP